MNARSRTSLYVINIILLIILLLPPAGMWAAPTDIDGQTGVEATPTAPGESIEVTIEPTIEPAPESTTEPTPDPTAEPTPQPSQSPSPTPQPPELNLIAGGDLSLVAGTARTLTLSFSLEPDGSQLEYLYAELSAGEDSPISIPAGEVAAGPDDGGWRAVFDGVSAAVDAPPGDYPLTLLARYAEGGEGAAERRAEFELTVSIPAPGCGCGEDGPDGHSGCPSEAEDCPEGCECPHDALALMAEDEPSNNLWTDGGAIVYDLAQLRAAVEGGQYSTVYLGYNDGTDETNPRNDGVITITDTSGIEISGSITICGTDPRNDYRMTLIDSNSSSLSANFSVTTAGLTVAVCDMDITGRNYYGIVYGSGYASTALKFINVGYTGRQIVHNDQANSSATFKGCTITLTNVGTGNPEEMCETSEVIFEGSNTVTSNTAASSLIWLKNSPYKLNVAPGATVSISTTNYFIYAGTAYADIQGSLTLTTSGASGCFTNLSQYMNSLTVGAAGSLTINHQSASYRTLYAASISVDGALTIDRTLGTNPLLELRASGSLTFGAGSRVALNNSGGAVISGASSASFSFSAQCVNLSNSYAAAVPDSVWNNQDLSPFTVTGTLATSTSVSSTGALSGGVGAAKGAKPLSGNFNLTNARRLALGPAALTARKLYPGDTAVSGTSVPGAVQTIGEYAYSAETGAGTLIQSAANIESDSSGVYQAVAVDLSPISEDGSIVYVASAQNGLLCQISALPVSELEFYDLPDSIDFEPVRISHMDQLAYRTDGGWAIRLFVPRSTAAWSLQAAIDAPLATSGGDELVGGLIFAAPGSATPLSSDAIEAASGAGDPDTWFQSVSWPESEGILVLLPAFEGVAGEEYATVIEWTLVGD